MTKCMPSAKTRDREGFTFALFRSCWNIINVKVMNVIHNFINLHVANLHWPDSTYIALLPQIDGAEDITEFRPTSLIHTIAVMLATWLFPLMNDLVSNTQSSFIKRRRSMIIYVRNLARWLHKNRTPKLLFKLDIPKASDSVRWGYILGILQRKGFPRTFNDWITTLLCISSLSVLLNGVPGPPSLTAED